MSSNHEQTLQQYQEMMQKMRSYEDALGVLYWDLRTGAPRKGIDVRAETIGTLSTELFRIGTSEQLGELLDRLLEPGIYADLPRMMQRSLEEMKKEYDRSKKIPEELYKRYVTLASQSEAAWEEAKPANDFAKFRPYLEQIVEFKKQFIDYWGFVDNKYDTLLDMYEPGMTVAKLDPIFRTLREQLVPLVADITAQRPRDFSYMKRTVPLDKQKALNTFLLGEMGFDFAAGRIDESAHPFATGLNPGDVRVTTRYLPDDLLYSLFSTMHEGGHALYEQQISKDLIGTNLCTGTSMGIHESQSRLWENMIGRSRFFWERYYPDLQRYIPEFADISLDAFYMGINEVKASFIRTESDELTYNLHIIIRYELEKELINGQLQVADLPSAWNEKYREYLGIVPPTDTLGVLQDVHWSDGGFGYFPSYSLGNMYAAQMMDAMRKALPALDDHVRQGRLAPINDWLREHIYQHGRLLTPSEIIEQIAGGPLDPSYFIQYLQQKFKRLYAL
jgi:carboxypeptidase Taq